MILCVVYWLRIFKMFHGLMNIPVYVCMDVHTYVYIYIYTYVHVYMYYVYTRYVCMNTH